MYARELGRRAALLHLKLAQVGPLSPTANPAGGADAAAVLGAKPAAPAPPTAPVAPKPPVAPVAPKPPAAPRPPTAPGGGGGIGGMLGGALSNLGSPAGIAQMMTMPGIKQYAEPIMGAVGIPGLAAVSNLARGGKELGTLMQGGIGNVKPGAV